MWKREKDVEKKKKKRDNHSVQLSVGDAEDFIVSFFLSFLFHSVTLSYSSDVKKGLFLFISISFSFYA